MNANDIRSRYILRTISSGDAIRLLQFHCGMTRHEAMRFLGL